MDACSRESTTGVRNRVLIATLYRAGLRIAEALSLLPNDVDLDAGTIRVLHGKGDRSRTVGIDAGATDLIKMWLKVREGLSPGVGARLFCTRSGTPMNTSYVRQFLPRLARRVGIEKRVHPHGLRHTHAAELAAENVPINVRAGAARAFRRSDDQPLHSAHRATAADLDNQAENLARELTRRPRAVGFLTKRQPLNPRNREARLRRDW
jgi:integrase